MGEAGAEMSQLLVPIKIKKQDPIPRKQFNTIYHSSSFACTPSFLDLHAHSFKTQAFSQLIDIFSFTKDNPDHITRVIFSRLDEAPLELQKTLHKGINSLCRLHIPSE